MPEFEQKASRRVAGFEMRQSDVDVDRIVGDLHRLDDRNARLAQQPAGPLGLIASGEHDRFGKLAERRLDRLFLEIPGRSWS